MTNTIANPADRLRAALKNAGFNARRVTVRTRHSTLYVTIRDASASLTRVRAIAKPFESVSRDQATGEMLQGGNTYVQVEYTEALVDPVKATILAVLDPAPNDEYVALPGGFRACKVSVQHGASRYVRDVRLEGPTFDLSNNLASGVTWAAERLAIAYLDATASGQGSAS